MLKIKKNTALLSEEAQRQNWPFNQMEIKDVVDIDDPTIWLDATKRAHTTASRKGWKMQTKWFDKKGFGRIRRVL